jgi:low temperature requirement protein LtrA
VTSGPAAPDPPDPSPADPDRSPGRVYNEPQLRVTTLELFFDLVFAFTLTQLAGLLAIRFSWAATGQVLLIFGLLWWMYEGYAWLTNTRPPVHTAERVLLLLGMAGFLVIGLAVPEGFAGSALALGLGYLAVVIVHALLYFRVNSNIIRVAPFSLASAVLVIVGSLLRGPAGTERPAGYALWVAALAVQLGSPLIVHPGGLFHLRPGHLSERHSALILVALGESVAAIGAGAGRTGAEDTRVAAAAVLGLALAAALWWIVFGGSDEETVERVLSTASSERRTALALYALFYGSIPVLLGLIAMASGIRQAISHSAAPAPGPIGAAVALAVGATLFLGGNVTIRRLLGLGLARLRCAAAVAVLATIAVGAVVSVEAQLAAITVLLVMLLVLEHQSSAARATSAAPKVGPEPD